MYATNEAFLPTASAAHDFSRTFQPLVITQPFARNALTSSSRSDGLTLAVGFNPLSLPKLLRAMRSLLRRVATA